MYKKSVPDKNTVSKVADSYLSDNWYSGVTIKGRNVGHMRQYRHLGDRSDVSNNNIHLHLPPLKRKHIDWENDYQLNLSDYNIPLEDVVMYQSLEKRAIERNYADKLAQKEVARLESLNRQLYVLHHPDADSTAKMTFLSDNRCSEDYKCTLVAALGLCQPMVTYKTLSNTVNLPVKTITKICDKNTSYIHRIDIPVKIRHDVYAREFRLVSDTTPTLSELKLFNLLAELTTHFVDDFTTPFDVEELYDTTQVHIETYYDRWKQINPDNCSVLSHVPLFATLYNTISNAIDKTPC